MDFQDVIDEMFMNEQINLVRHAIHKPAPDVLVSILEDSSGATVPDHMLSFYADLTDGLDLDWFLEDEDDVGGSIEIYGLARVFGTWLDEIWGVGDDTDFSWELRGIEAAHEGQNYQTMVHIAEFAPTYDLYFREPAGQSHRIEVDFVEYLSLALESRGFWGWQFLVSDVDFEQHALAREVSERFHKWMPELFEDVDLSRFKKHE